MAAAVEEAAEDALLVTREDDALTADSEAALAFRLRQEVRPARADPAGLENVTAFPAQDLLGPVGLGREGPGASKVSYQDAGKVILGQRRNRRAHRAPNRRLQGGRMIQAIATYASTGVNNYW
jgi:hypothetical protein